MTNWIRGVCQTNRDVLGLIEALGLAAPVLLGHSMGGMTAAVAAGQAVSLETARELRLNQRLRYERIPDVGRGLPYDQPDRFAAVVRSFLKSVIAP